MTATTVGAVRSERRASLRLTEDQQELASVARSFLSDVFPARTADRAAWADVDPDRAAWRRMAGELGLHGLALPEAVDGQGFGVAEMAIVFEELGRALVPAPMLGTVGLAARTLLHCPPSSARDEALAGIAAGELVVATTVGGSADVTVDGDGRLSGRTGALVDGAHADLFVVAAGAALHLVRGDAAGVVRTPVEGIDLTRGLARLTLDDTPGELVAGPPDADQAAARGLAEATILLAAESVGAARAALDEAVAYSKVRTQFGRQIGSFQALKHRMADILIAVEGAWSTTRHAAVVADIEPAVPLAELQLAAGVAKGAASAALLFAASEDIQIHGGIGFTWEHSAHLYYRRAKSSEVLLGLPQQHHERTATLLGHALATDHEGSARGHA